MSTRRPKPSAKQIDIAERRARVAELTRVGRTAPDIAAALRTSTRQVERDRAAWRTQRQHVDA